MAGITVLPTTAPAAAPNASSDAIFPPTETQLKTLERLLVEREHNLSEQGVRDGIASRANCSEMIKYLISDACPRKGSSQSNWTPH